jgi:hypothetical protein
MVKQHQSNEHPVAMCAILSLGMAADYGECAIVTPDIFEVVHNILNEEDNPWGHLSDSVMEELRQSFIKQKDDYPGSFEEELRYNLSSFEQLYLFISNSNYSKIEFSFAKSFYDIGEFANYVREQNIKIIETLYGNG